MSAEWSSDINVVSGALKLWLRELPEPLLTYGLYDAFIEAASEYESRNDLCASYPHLCLGYDNDRLRYIRLHGQVNNLPDPNYATLKYFMGHLDRYVLGSKASLRKADRASIRKLESKNSMSISNLSIVFGPTLLGAPPEMGGLNLEHMSFQCKVSFHHIGGPVPRRFR